MNNNFSNSANPSPPPPSISLTPSNPHKVTAKPRSRAGTLPASFLGSDMASGGGVNVGSGIEAGGPLSNATSPSVAGGNSESLNLPTMDSISLGVPSSPCSNAIDIPNGGGGTRRMRSGSLFSANSIWNDDAISLQSPSQTGSNLLENSSLQSFDIKSSSSVTSNNNNENMNGNNNFISPVLAAENSTSSHHRSNSGTSSNTTTASNNNHNVNSNQRYRSYTTTAAIPNVNSNPLPMSNNYAMDPLSSNRMATSPFASSNKTNDMNSLLDNLMINMNNNSTSGTTRHRSQTFSGSTPILPDSNAQQQQQQEQLLAQNLFQHNPPSQRGSHLLNQQPLLQDDFTLSQVMLTTSFENPKLGPTKCLLFDNLPQFIDSAKLWPILNNSLGSIRAAGSISSVRVSGTSSSNLALVECTTVDLAMGLKANFNHLELVPGIILYVAFARFSDRNNNGSAATESSIRRNPSVSAPLGQSSEKNGGLRSTVDNAKTSSTDLILIQESLMAGINKLSSTNKFVDLNKIISIINKSISYSNDNYQDNFGPLPDPIPLRQFDSPKLRELRKILENNDASSSPQTVPSNTASDSDDYELSNKIMTQLELEELCLAMLDELPELCYDYLGNTIVQKIFSVVESPLIKLMMVKEITPFLTQLSIHKNGTWAIQKIINLCHNDYQQKYLIAASLKPYAVKLFNDQFGNYVLQGCLKFGPPFNDFIFETMLDNFLEISYGRFGARCIRTILETANESGVISHEQVILVAGLIIQFANELVVNNNGSLLITWFLDTFNGCGATKDDRFELLREKFSPNLDKLCIHKLANLTILKILNNRSDLDSKQIIMDSIFGKFEESEGGSTARPLKLLETILSESPDNSAGPLFIYKILSNPLLLMLSDEKDSNRNAGYQQFIASQIRSILLEISITNLQPYKKLMDEVGLSTTRLNRSTSLGNRRTKRGGRNATGKMQSSQSQVGNQHLMNPMGYPTMQNTPGQGSVASHYSMAPQFQHEQGQHAYPMMMPPQVMMPGIANQSQPLSHQQPHHLQHPSQQQQQQQHDMAVMQQLEQLSLSSAALGYNSNPGTPGVNANQRKSFF